MIPSERESRPTVAVDARALLTGPHGIATYTSSLLRELHEGGRFRLIAVAHRRVEDLPAGIEQMVQPAPSGVVWQQLRLPLWLRRHQPALFWSPLQTLPVLAPLVARRVALVTTVHDLTVLSHSNAHTRKVWWSQVPLLRASLSAARRIVAISQATRRELERFYPRATRDRIRAVENGIDPDFRPSDPATITAVRARLGLPDGYLLAVGTLEPRKNLGLLLDAWEPLRRRGAAPPLLLAGPEGWGEEALRARLLALEPLGVRRLGTLPRPELVEVMASASVFVYPSLAEGFGLPPAEAMACGAPTIVCNVSSLPEVVGDAGLLVDPTDPVALGTAIERVLTNPELALDLRQRGIARAQRFTWSRAATEMEAVFMEAIG